MLQLLKKKGKVFNRCYRFLDLNFESQFFLYTHYYLFKFNILRILDKLEYLNK